MNIGSGSGSFPRQISENSRISRISRKCVLCVVMSDYSNGLATSMRFCSAFQLEENPWKTRAVRGQSVVWMPKFQFLNSVDVTVILGGKPLLWSCLNDIRDQCGNEIVEIRGVLFTKCAVTRVPFEALF